MGFQLNTLTYTLESDRFKCRWEVGNGKEQGGSPPGFSGSKLATSWAETILSNVGVMHFLLRDLAATQHFGASLAACIEEKATCVIVALEGPLGAGKTTLVKAVGAALGVREVISSPTFTMLNEYDSGRLPLFHLDIYRGGETGETMDLDTLAQELEEMLGLTGGLAMIEWPKYFICDGKSFFEDRDYLDLVLAYADSPDKSLENPGSVARVLREESPPEKYIKDGFTEARIATLSANGVQSAILLAELTGKLSDMVINL